MKKKTFLFFYKSLGLGGIDIPIIQWVENYSARGIRIVWLQDGIDEEIYPKWNELLSRCGVERVPVKIGYFNWFRWDNVAFEKEEEIFAVAFSPYDFARLEFFAKKNSNRYGCDFNLFYMVPHFEDAWYYLEDGFGEKKRLKVQKKLAEIYNRLYKNNSLLFFSKRHEDAMCERYGVPCIGDKERLFENCGPVKPFDEDLARKRAERKEFEIVTCSRFDFPHKGYLFGLIDTYAKLKPEFPKLKLKIVGCGSGEKQLRDRVSRLPVEVASDICFTGPIDPYSMVNVYNESNLNVAVAGAASDGAKTGLVTLPARHYSESCEVYGWLSPENSNTVRDEPGEPLEKYLRELLTMSDENYIDLCRKSYNAKAKQTVNENWLFEQENQVKNYYHAEEVKYIHLIYLYDQGPNPRKLIRLWKEHQRKNETE